MTVQNPESESILLELATQIACASQEIACEERLATAAEIEQSIVHLNSQTSWVERLARGAKIRLKVNNIWIFGTIQHSCPAAIVIVNSEQITIINSLQAQQIFIGDAKIQKQQHSNNKCWHSILNQVHDVIVHCDREKITGSISLINKDAIDIKGSNGICTVPWSQVGHVAIPL